MVLALTLPALQWWQWLLLVFATGFCWAFGLRWGNALAAGIAAPAARRFPSKD
jgi:hypothetical protein